MKNVARFIGLVVTLLGGLWLLQGIGIVQMRPILCFGDCAVLQGPSAKWAVVGALVLTAGAAVLWWSWKRRAA